MEINNNPSFGKKRIDMKKDVEQKSLAPAQKEMSDEERTVLEKIRSSALSSYVAASMALGMLGTSCVQQSQETIIDLDAEEFKKLLQQMIELQQQTIDAINAFKDQNSDENKQIIENLQNINKVLGDIYTGVMSIDEGIEQITLIMQEQNEHDAEFLAKLEQILNSNKSQEEKLQLILEENQKQNAFLANIGPYIQVIAQNSEESADTLKQFYEAYLAGDITRSEFMAKMLEMAEKQNGLSEEILAEIREIKAAYESGRMEEADALKEIAALLASIDGKMDTVIEWLAKISGDIAGLSDKLDNNNDEVIEKLNQIAIAVENGNEISEAQMAELIELTKAGNKTAAEILAKMDGMGDTLIQIRDKDGNLELAELIKKYGDKLGEDFATVIEWLSSFDPTVKIENIDDIINAINNAKPDLSKIQEQMGTIIVLMQRAQSSGITSDDFLAIVEEIKALKASNAEGAAATNANLAEILASLSRIEGMTEIMVEVAGETLSAVNKYGAAAEVAFEDLTDGMKDLIDGQITKEDADELLAKYRTNLNQTEASLSQSVQLLQAILDAQGEGQGSSGLTKDELADVIENSAIFNQIAGLLEDLNIDRVTNETLNTALATHKTDLSKIQEQLGTVIVLLQRTQSSTVTVDTSKLETAVNTLADVVSNQGVTSNAGIQELKAQLAEMIELLKEVLGDQAAGEATRMLSAKPQSDIIYYEHYVD